MTFDFSIVERAPALAQKGGRAPKDLHPSGIRTCLETKEDKGYPGAALSVKPQTFEEMKP
jgi:hypothetical protein